MSFSNFQLVQSIRKSPAVLWGKFSKDKASSLSRGDPFFKLHYLGVEKVYSLQIEHTHDVVQNFMISTKDKVYKDHALVIRPRYVEVKDIATGCQITKTYLHDIAYCTADTVYPNVFLYICKHKGQLLCRVFLCKKAEKAKAITACLASNFEKAFSDWRKHYSEIKPIPEDDEAEKKTSLQSQGGSEPQQIPGHAKMERGDSTEDEAKLSHSLGSDDEAELQMHQEFHRRLSSTKAPHRLDTGQHDVDELVADHSVQQFMMGDEEED
ncbi:uncharacterized protein LOC122806699 [Protopterus annectens]|uniref:uncharacterized protein LOC122806699 n=1 Tax=Protopterus annectens TaxID=7888 RepID=UPI001CFA6663|nr:uncharacterized protein LOC122806699 [Protopterus annectens]